MKLLNRNIKVKDVIQMIDARLQAVTIQYQYAKGQDRKIEAEAMAETKWQIAELKMQFLDSLIQSAADDLEQQNV